MSRRIFILPLWIRVWHWTNALLILILTVTGASLHFSNPDLALVRFDLAARVHDVAGLLLVALYGFFVVANIISGNWWQYVPKPGVLGRCMLQSRYYLWGIFRGEEHPFPVTKEANFNPLQQIIYWAIMYAVMPTLLITGLVFFWPDVAPKRLFGYDGLIPIAVLHYIAALIIVTFMVAHIYLGTTGKRISSLFKMMITGWHEH